METIWLRSKKRLLIQRILLKRKAEKKRLVVAMGLGKKQWAVSIDLEVILSGERAEVEVLGIMRGRGKEKLSLKILIHHQAPQTKANVLVKAVVDDEARVDFNGKIKIEKSAQLSTAFLRTQTLILSSKARVNCLPQLEIDANDVKAGHAATIGKIDEEQIFYLMSRGLERQQSEQLIVDGFLREIVDRIRDRDIKYQILNIKNTN